MWFDTLAYFWVLLCMRNLEPNMTRAISVFTVAPCRCSRCGSRPFVWKETCPMNRLAVFLLFRRHRWGIHSTNWICATFYSRTKFRGIESGRAQHIVRSKPTSVSSDQTSIEPGPDLIMLCYCWWTCCVKICELFLNFQYKDLASCMLNMDQLYLKTYSPLRYRNQSLAMSSLILRKCLFVDRDIHMPALMSSDFSHWFTSVHFQVAFAAFAAFAARIAATLSDGSILAIGDFESLYIHEHPSI